MESAQKTSAKSNTKQNQTESNTQAPKKPIQIIAIVVAVIAGLALIGLYFLLNVENHTNNDSDTIEEETISANCSATECLAKLATSDGVEKITEIIGVEPKTDEAAGTAKWKLSSKESIAREKSGSSYILQATIDKTKIASHDLDFSIFGDLKSELEGGNSFTYDELVQRLGGNAGTLAGKTDTSKRYVWVNGQNQTFSATFSDKTGECSIISLR